MGVLAAPSDGTRCDGAISGRSDPQPPQLKPRHTRIVYVEAARVDACRQPPAYADMTSAEKIQAFNQAALDVINQYRLDVVTVGNVFEIPKGLATEDGVHFRPKVDDGLDWYTHISSMTIAKYCDLPGGPANDSWHQPTCWIRLPTGCNQKLCETKSPQEWFVDPLVLNRIS